MAPKPQRRLQLGLAMLSVAASFMGQSMGQTSLLVTNGQGFADGVLGWMSSGGTTTLQLQQTISMNATQYAQQPLQGQTGAFPNGILTLAGSSNGTLLDCAMQSGLTPEWDVQNAGLVWSNVILINLCTEALEWNENLQIFVLSASNTWLIPRSRTFQSQTRNNVTLYIPMGEMLSVIYWQVLVWTPFSRIKPWVDTLLSAAPNTNSRVSHVDLYSVTFQYMLLAGGIENNVTYRATNNPDDPLRLSSLGGGLMESRFCNGLVANGTLLTAAQYAANVSVTPMWLTDQSNADAQIAAVASYTLNQPDASPPPVLMFVANVSMTSLSQGISIRRDTILHGPFNHVASEAVVVAIDWSLKANVLSVSTSAVLFLSKLIMTGLSSSLLPGSTSTQSALPLWAISTTSGNIQVQADNITLELPESDFLALLSAALRAPNWSTGAVVTARVVSGIAELVPQQDVVPSLTEVVLQTYSGWGLNATNLRLVPATLLSVGTVIPDLRLLSAVNGTRTSNSDTRREKFGIGVGVGVGGAVLLSIIVGILLLLRNGKQSKQDDAYDKSLNGSRAISAHDRALTHMAVHQAQQAMQHSVSLGSEVVFTTPSTHLALAIDHPRAPHSDEDATRTDPEISSSPLPSQSRLPSIFAQATAGGIGKALTTPSKSLDLMKWTADPHKAVQDKAGMMHSVEADKLTLLSVLGRGAWGTVYKGQWRGLVVAVKTVLFSEREDGDRKLPHERAIMEAAVCTSVAHRNVVATYHYDIKPVRAVMDGEDHGLKVEMAAEVRGQMGQTDWKLYLVQEWCNSTLGQALRSWLLHKQATKEPLLDLMLELLVDVASGLQYLHDKNIIHGDIKPENVLLKTDATAPIGVVAKIADFGLSTTLGPTATHVSNYNSGTPFYVAPEVTSQGRTTKASDTYSVGVLIWETYCCTPPWIKVGNDYQANLAFPIFPFQTPKPLLHLAQNCLLLDPRKRPTLAVVVVSLRGMLNAWQHGHDSLQLPVCAPATSQQISLTLEAASVPVAAINNCSQAPSTAGMPGATRSRFSRPSTAVSNSLAAAAADVAAEAASTQVPPVLATASIPILPAAISISFPIAACVSSPVDAAPPPSPAPRATGASPPAVTGAHPSPTPVSSSIATCASPSAGATVTISTPTTLTPFHTPFTSGVRPPGVPLAAVSPSPTPIAAATPFPTPIADAASVNPTASIPMAPTVVVDGTIRAA